MNIREAAIDMRYYISADIAVALWGAPGIGKTEVVHWTAAHDMDDCAVHVEALNLYESVDLRGLPVNEGGAVVWSVPEMFQRLRALAAAHKTVILFLDEWNTAAPSVMVCAAQLVHTRRVGPHELPANVRIVCAGNRQSDRASANRTPSMLNNRLAHIDVEPDAKIWRDDWANIPGNNCHPALNAFIGFRPNMLHDMKDKDARAFPSPRSWAQVSKVLHNAPA
jgi:MoxR-like ATPase